MRAEQVSDTSTANGTDWRAVADELATALRQALLRNPSLPAWAWEQGQAALNRYDSASGTVRASSQPSDSIKTEGNRGPR